MKELNLAILLEVLHQRWMTKLGVPQHLRPRWNRQETIVGLMCIGADKYHLLDDVK